MTEHEELVKELRQLFDKTTRATAFSSIDYPARVNAALVAIYAYGKRKALTDVMGVVVDKETTDRIDMAAKGGVVIAEYPPHIGAIPVPAALVHELIEYFTQPNDTASAWSFTDQRRKEIAAALTASAVEPVAELHVVFDGPPSHESGRFVEVESADGRGVRIGRWEQRGDFWHLILTGKDLATPPSMREVMLRDPEGGE